MTTWEPVADHRAVPVEVGHVLRCNVCGGAVRQWPDGRFPIHAQPQPQRLDPAWLAERRRRIEETGE